MNFLFTVVILISITMILIELIRILLKIKESKDRLRQNKKIIDSFDFETQHAIYFEKLCKREEVLYQSYILHNSLYLICNFFSLKYSIATFATTVIPLNSDASWKATLLSVLTMTFVIINMCIKPQQHANQYLLAWRRYDIHTQTILQKNYAELTSDEVSNIINESIKIQAKIENSLKQDEKIGD